MKKFKKLAYSLLAAGAFAFSAIPAHASLILTLSDGVNNVSVNDGGTGFVSYAGAIGSWAINVATGLNFSDANVASLDLNSINAVLSGSGLSTLTIRLTQDNLTAPAGANTSGTAHVGGTTQGSVTFNSYFNNLLVASLGTFNSPSFSNDVNFGGLDTTSAFSLTNEVIINQNGRGVTSFDMVTNVPEPETLGLLGLGLLGLGLARRRMSV